MADNQTEFVFSAKDQVTPVVGGIVKALGALDVATGGADKSIGQLEKTLGSAIGKFSGGAAGIGTYAASMKKLDATIAETAASMKSMTDANGKLTLGNSTNAKVAEYQKLQSTLVGAIAKQKEFTAAELESAKAAVAAAQTNGKFSYAKSTTAQIAAYRDAQNAVSGLTTRMGALNAAHEAAGKSFENASGKASRFGAILDNVPPNSTRYALYDVSNSLALVGAGLTAGGVAAVTFGAQFERAFADVKRTVNDLGTGGIEKLRNDLVDMSKKMPVAFEDLSHIASLGGQMGISGKGIDDFVDSIAKISTVSDLSVDAAATAFGRFKALLKVPEEQFDNLASSILKVGVNSVATESQIVAISVQIASMADYAGFSAEQVIGLSGALASIGAPPELSRGLITRLFAKMGEAVSGGGTALESFSDVAGVTSDQFREAWGTNEFASVFQKFMAGIRTSGGAALGTLKGLGITSVRDVPLLLRLAGAANSAGQAGGLLAQTMSDAAKGWKENSELNKQYAMITDTVVEKLKILGNAFKALLAGAGGAALGPLKGLIDLLAGFANMISDNQVLTGILGISLAVGVLTGGLLLLTAGLARAGGAILGMQTATLGLVGSFAASRAALVGMGVSLSTTTGLMSGAAVIARGLGAAFFSLLGPIGLVVGALSLLATYGNDWANGLDSMAGVSKDLKDVEHRFTTLKGTVSGFSSGTAVTEFAKWDKAQIQLARSLGEISSRGAGDLKILDEAMAKMVNSGNGERAAKMYQDLKEQWVAAHGSVKNFNVAFTDTAEAFRNAAPGAKSTAEAVKSVAEASDEAVDRYDALTSALMSGSAAFLNTGDMIKANQEQQKAAFQATATAGMDAANVTGEEWQQFYNGQTVNLQTYLEQLQTSANAQAAWAENIKTLGTKLGENPVSKEILADLAKLGPEGAPLVQALVDGTDVQLDAYVALWKAAGTSSAEQLAIATVSAQFVVENALKSVGTASQAAFIAAMKSGKPMDDVLAQFGLDAAGNKVPVYINTDPMYSDAATYFSWLSRQNPSISVRVGFYSDGSPARVLPGVDSYEKNYATGGYTGSGGKYDVAGAVHKGEFVFDKESTSAIGPSELYSMMRAARGGKSVKRNGGFAGGGYAGGGGGGTQVIELSPYDRRLLARAGDVQLTIGNEQIAAAANRTSITASKRGTR